eukprot:scaffold56284_cov66-Phaeocystis_antarctica.AAC.1
MAAAACCCCVLTTSLLPTHRGVSDSRSAACRVSSDWSESPAALRASSEGSAETPGLARNLMMCGGSGTAASSSEHRIHAARACTAASLLSATRPTRRCSEPSIWAISSTPSLFSATRRLAFRMTGIP